MGLAKALVLVEAVALEGTVTRDYKMGGFAKVSLCVLDYVCACVYVCMCTTNEREGIFCALWIG